MTNWKEYKRQNLDALDLPDEQDLKNQGNHDNPKNRGADKRW